MTRRQLRLMKGLWVGIVEGQFRFMHQRCSRALRAVASRLFGARPTQTIRSSRSSLVLIRWLPGQYVYILTPMEWLNYHHLYYFWLVAREGSIARAAERMRLSHPTISKQLSQLESALEGKLFDRVGRTLVLTDLGRTVLGYADGNLRCRARIAGGGASWVRWPAPVVESWVGSGAAKADCSSAASARVPASGARARHLP